MDHFLEMTSILPRQRPLAQLIREHKTEHHVCDCCGDEMKRVTIVHEGKIVPRAQLLERRTIIGEDDWIDERHHWKCFCRFCAGVLTLDGATGFEVSGFYRWLRATTMKRASVREYIVRMRRLVESMPGNELRRIMAAEDIAAELLRHYENEQTARNYSIALAKYIQFETWRKR